MNTIFKNDKILSSDLKTKSQLFIHNFLEMNIIFFFLNKMINKF